MNLLQLLTELSRQQIALTVTRDCISTNKPVDQIPEHLINVLRLNKQTLIDLFFTSLDTGTPQLEEQKSSFPVTIVWPADKALATIEGQTTRLDNGRVEAVYHTKEELRDCLEFTKFVRELSGETLKDVLQKRQDFLIGDNETKTIEVHQSSIEEEIE